MLTIKQKTAFSRIFKSTRVLKFESMIHSDIDIRSQDFAPSVTLLYVSRIFSNCEAAFILLQKELFAECRMMLRSAFEVALIVHFLKDNPSLIYKCREHSIIQRYIELLDIKNRNACPLDLQDEFRQDLRRTRARLNRLKHYSLEKGRLKDLNYLTRKIGSTPIKVWEVINYIKSSHQEHCFENAFWGQDIDDLKFILYGRGSSEIHSYFDNVVNLEFSNAQALFYLRGLVHSGLVALQNMESGMLRAYGVDIDSLRNALIRTIEETVE